MSNEAKNLNATFDIMIGGVFKGQITIPVVPFYEYPENYFRQYVEQERPSLQGKAFTLQPTSNKVFR